MVTVDSVLINIDLTTSYTCKKNSHKILKCDSLWDIEIKKSIHLLMLLQSQHRALDAKPPSELRAGYCDKKASTKSAASGRNICHLQRKSNIVMFGSKQL